MRKQKKTFDQFLQRRGITLNPQQDRACRAFLKAMAPGNEGPNGKSFALMVLTSFINEHGNIYCEQGL